MVDVIESVIEEFRFDQVWRLNDFLLAYVRTTDDTVYTYGNQGYEGSFWTVEGARDFYHLKTLPKRIR